MSLFSLSYVTIWPLLVGSYLAWYITSAILTWYRLRDFPAPSFIAHFSYLWQGKTTFSGKQYWVHCELHKKYGPLVRIGPNDILTDDPKIIKKISSARTTYHRGDWYLTGRFHPHHGNVFSLLEPAVHAKARGQLAPAYSGRELEDMEMKTTTLVQTMVDLLSQKYIAKSKKSPSVDLGLMSSFFAMDVITSLGFGQELGYLKEETDHHNFLASLRDLWPIMSTSAEIPWIRSLLFSKPFLRWFGPKPTDRAGFGALMGAAEKLVGRRFASGTEEKDMLGSFIRHGLNRQQCEAESLFMIIAGLESTASAIRSILVHVMTCPRVYQKLKQEIHMAVSQSSVSTPVTYSEAKRLPYLQAVIYEGLRMRPPLLGLFPKIVPADGDTFHGRFVPASTAICTNTSSLLRSTTLFGDDAHVFRPERFIEQDKTELAEMQRNVELCFGYGLNMCMGKTLSFMELNKLVFELFKAFDLQLLSPMKPCDVMSYGVFIEKNLLVRVTEDDLLFKGGR